MASEWNPYLLALFTGLGTVLSEGYRRFFTNQQERDDVELLQKKADLAVTMRDNNLSANDLAAAAGTIIAEKREAQTASLIGSFESESSMKAELRAVKGSTQAEMNAQSAIDFRDAVNDLDSALIDLNRYLTDGEREALDKAQAAWNHFREAQTAFVAAQWEGGSMQPLMANLESADITKRRAIEIQGFLSDVSGRRVPVDGSQG